MSSLIFSSQSNLSEATVTAGEYAPAAPPSFLLKREPSDKCILTTDPGAYIVVDLKRSANVRMLQALYVETTTTRPMTWRWRAAATEAELTSSPGYDSGNIPFAPDSLEIPIFELNFTTQSYQYGLGNDGLKHRSNTLHDFLWLDSVKRYRWWRLDFDRQCAVGNIILHPGWQPAFNATYTMKPAYLVDPSVKRRYISGRVSVWGKVPYDSAEFNLDFLSKEEALKYARDLDEAVGTRLPVSIVFEPEATTYKQETMIFGLLEESNGPSNDYFQIYSRNYEIAELIP